MKLYIVRHAEAVERSADIAEAARYLTPAGRAAFRKTARTMRRQGIKPECILTSPLARAVQTADILAEALDYEGPLMVSELLSPGFDRQGLKEALALCGQAREVVLVGHEPDLGELAAALLGIRGGFPMKKGGALALKFDPAREKAATFKWLANGSKLVESLDTACAG